MFYQLPPAGERIVVKRKCRADRSTTALFDPFLARFYASGTTALAAALKACVVTNDTRDPEVIVPAYGCPDLVSAVLCAGARPRLVDLAPDRPWIDLDRLRSALSANTVAVVAVDLFGIPERYTEIRALLQGSGIRLVQDSAQALPRPDDGQWQGDLVVLSFGRGKPVSVLGGGAVLFRDLRWGGALPAASVPARATLRDIVQFQLKARAYNALLSPRLYWLPASLPFLGLGETRYEPLDSIEPADPLMEEVLPANIERYWRRPDTAQLRLTTLVAEVGGNEVLDLSRVCARSGRMPRLLRYPLLVNAALRDELFCTLKSFGASKMYPRALSSMPGLEGLLLTDGPCSNAEAFARRMLALPVHSQVRELDLLRMRDGFQSLVRRQHNA